jgi:hypothetical protein
LWLYSMPMPSASCFIKLFLYACLWLPCGYQMFMILNFLL